LAFYKPENPPPSSSSPQQQWDIILFESLAALDWSEYTLYWVYACKSGLIDKHHHTGTPAGAYFRTDPKTRLYPYQGFKLDAKAVTASLDQAAAVYFKDKRTLFGVVQSIAGVEPLAVLEKLMPFYQKGRLACKHEIRDMTVEEIMLSGCPLAPRGPAEF